MCEKITGDGESFFKASNIHGKRFCGKVGKRNEKMIFEILTDTRKIDKTGDRVLSEMVAVSNATEEQKLRRLDGTGANDNFLVAKNVQDRRRRAAGNLIFYSDSAVFAAFKNDSADMSPALDVQIGLIESASISEICARRRNALAFVNGEL